MFSGSPSEQANKAGLLERRDEIITRLYEDADIADAIGKMRPVELQDDLRSEMFMVLCQMDAARLIDLHERKILKFYLVRTMLTMIKSDRSTFFKVYRRYLDELPEGFTEMQDKQESNEEAFARVEQAMDGLHWYEKSVMEQFAELKNISELSRRTKIPYRSLSKTISDARKKIKTEIKSNIKE